MESNIPLPTDNIYKFYALFGLLLFVFSLAETFYIVHSSNEYVFQSIAEVESIKQIQMPTTAQLAKLKHFDLAIANRTFEQHALGALGGVATLLMVYGFWKWHRDVQPVQDEMAKLQLEKLRIEVEQLRKPVVTTAAVETPKDPLEAED